METRNPVRILIAEDEELTRVMVRTQLEQLGYEVVGEAETGEDAVRLALQTRPDVVILDIRMPVMDGIEAARQIVSQHPCAVVFLTAYAEEELITQATQVGAYGYLLKPFRKQELAPAITLALTRFREMQAKDREVRELQEALETRKLIERAKGILMDRLGLSEAEAFRRIHFMARNQNKTMKEIAQSVITAAEIL
ncbi:MAG: response regulator [Fimbriimonadales bacterium]|nr:response regulator [Armatimonadota bacterium]MCX7687244.1 response regulator [Fimbriimonadales bacterium]CUU02929.1 response regulator receiver and ANTAR domain protein [Armatimonadetes bacterium GBS]CUU34895.1 response regulator receiver and ANTAR domain protein [Armatimonadetes bacterium DC]CUU37134.1 response regulator receiver and ANTAR domain protein [Armatimonadetes bacterium GXS]GBC89309.1 putative transcriptional regulatory protein pdtaR [bacterium HR14]